MGRGRNRAAISGEGAAPAEGIAEALPAHLNELSPEEARGTFPGFVYQTGNLLAAINLTVQTHIAVTNGNDYALAMALVTGVVAVVIALLIAFGPEQRGVAFGRARLRSGLAPAAGNGGRAATMPLLRD
ncbi:hypothetical protein KXR53_27225 [Inquilinus limosus]|uniref:hypothetical protein n=1 Tax=Inquilinus limosus TaxID=171674 RepID=UPI003F16EF96